MRRRSLARKSRSESGTVTVFTVLAMSALLGVMALAIDTGWMYVTRLQLQNAADATAVGALRSFVDEGEVFPAAAPPSEIPFEMVAGNEVAVRHTAGGLPVLLQLPDDIVFGFWDFGTRTFAAGPGFGSPAVRVTARRSQGSPGGPIGLFFARLLGRPEADVAATAVAAIRRRELVIVQDRTYSFVDEFDDAQNGDKALVETMVIQSIAGDRVGLVTFARDATEEAPLTELSVGAQSMLEATIDAFEVCTGPGSPGGPCFGTDLSVGIDEAREMFASGPPGGNAERVMVVVSDGIPCLGELLPSTDAVTEGQALATAAADRAEDDGINIFVVTLDQGESPQPGNPCFGGDVTFNESLARGFGQGFTTTDEEDLDELLASISRAMPVRLVD
jgi:hypothetical protein